MICQWEPLIQILPESIRSKLRSVDRNQILEIRMRLDRSVEWVCRSEKIFFGPQIKQEELDQLVNAASRFSPWASESISQGYISIDGGHRIGLCGEMIIHNNMVKGIRKIRSVCIRIARDVEDLAQAYYIPEKSVLVIGAPGWGKTTMLRDYARVASDKYTTAVIDERGELYPKGFKLGKRMDVYRGCGKKEGIELALRTMSPQVIALDEITAEEDCALLIRASNCGIRILATAHAENVQDLRKRPMYRNLLEHGVFSEVLVLNKDRFCTLERVECH